MPTGYTHGVQEGKVTEFRDYAMQCARAFGATIMMRDEPASTPIPEAFEPSSYNAQRLEESKALLAKLLEMTPEEAAKACEKENREQAAYAKKANERRAVEQSRYEAMLAKAEAWEPPSVEHREFKKFMCDQLRESIRFDCSPYEGPEPLSPEAWMGESLRRVRRDIEYHTKAHAEELERTAGRNKWIADLRSSLA
jgi:hypothetical protein